MEYSVKHKDGTNENLQSRSHVSGVAKLLQSRTFMGDDKLSVEVMSAQPMSFRIGDKIEVNGQPYTLNSMPMVRKQGESDYSYTLEFESVQYQLVSSQFLLFDSITDDMVAYPSQYELTGLMFNSVTGTALDVLKMIVLNANRTAGDGQWSIGTCPEDTDTLNFTLDRGTCLEALQQLCEDWSLEFTIATTDGVNVINLREKPQTFPFPICTMTFGRVGGLISIVRDTKTYNVTTRLYAYGGTQNVPSDYIAQSDTNRLCIRHQDGTRKRHQSFVENAGLVAQYGIREAVFTFDDIFPKRTGSVSSIVTGSDNAECKFRDLSMFDLNERNPDTGETRWLIPGTTAKVVFQTGQLAGYSFDIVGYDHSTHLFTIASIKEEGDLVLPSPDNTTLRIAVGDTYILTDIRMPTDYITAAEDELSNQAAKKLAELNSDMYRYTIEVDSRWTKRHAEDWGRPAEQPYIPGDFVGINDIELGISVNLRLTGVTHDIISDKYTLTVERYIPKRKTKDTEYRGNIIATEQARRTNLAVAASQNIATSAIATSMIALESAQVAHSEIDRILPFIPVDPSNNPDTPNSDNT